MARVVFTASADSDVASILDLVAADAGQSAAARYRILLRRLYLRLADHPDSGPLRPALGPDIRIGVVRPYIVIYRHEPADHTVTILRIVHGRRRTTPEVI